MSPSQLFPQRELDWSRGLVSIIFLRFMYLISKYNATPKRNTFTERLIIFIFVKKNYPTWSLADLQVAKDIFTSHFYIALTNNKQKQLLPISIS